MQEIEKISLAVETLTGIESSLDQISKAFQGNQNLVFRASKAMQASQNEAIQVMQSFMAKGINSPFDNMGLSPIQILAKNLQFTKPKIPNSVFEAMEGIGMQQTRISHQFESISLQYQKAFSPSHLERLQTVFGGLSIQLTAQSFAEKDWETLDEVHSIVTEVADINERVLEQDYASKQDIEDIKALVILLLPKVKKKNIITLLLWLHLVFESLWTYGEMYLAARDEMKPQTAQPATKQDIDNIKKELFDALKQERRLIRITNRICKVRSNPKNKSAVIETLPQNNSVLVIGKKGKWAQINFTSSKDGFPDTGWCLKKYLSAQK
jgi:Holliday junction resolvase RusA-like endonuclease